MATKRMSKTYDDLLELKDAGLVAASAAAQVSSANKILDLGRGTAGELAGSVEGDIIIDVTACEVASDDEKYIIGAQISSSSTFASDIYEVCSLTLGSAGTAAGDNLAGDVDMGTGRYVLPFRNEIANGEPKRYMRLYTHVSGTIATGINYKAYLAKDD
jgi:hypothetical protein